MPGRVPARVAVLTVALSFWGALAAAATPAEDETEPVAHVFASVDGVDLIAYVFTPEGGEERMRPAVVIFHGGGWSIGEPEWGFGRARHYAERGLVAVSAQYRLSDEESVTPIEAMADARAVIRWMRTHRDELGIDPDRIVAYGWSAGAHLAACAAIFDEALDGAAVSTAPDALILASAAVSVTHDSWFQRLLGDRAEASSLSPDENVREGLPPTLILQGATDTVTPLAGARRFDSRMRAAGNPCQLVVYEGVGHLYTPAGIPDNGWPQPDAEVARDARERADRFLVSLGFME